MLEPAGDRGNFLLGLLRGDARFQPRIRFDPASVAILEFVSAAFEDFFHRGRHPELHRPAYECSIKSLRGDSNDCVRDAVEALRFSDDLRIAFEAALPKLVADRRYGMRAAGCIFSRQKSAAEDGVHADGVKIIRGNNASESSFGALPDAERGACDFADEKRIEQRAVPL